MALCPGVETKVKDCPASYIKGAEQSSTPLPVATEELPVSTLWKPVVCDNLDHALEKELGIRKTSDSPIGAGVSSEVFKYRSEDGRFFAVKVFNEEFKHRLCDIEGEMNALVLKHPNIAKTYALVFQREKVFTVFGGDVKKIPEKELSNSAFAAVVCELVPGQEMDVSLLTPSCEVTELINITCQLCEAIQYMHETHRMIHRDIKKENMIYDPETGVLKLIDMGFVKTIGGRLTRSFKGSRALLAPEVWAVRRLPGAEYGYPVDKWGVGVFLMDMITGCVPSDFSRTQKALVDTGEVPTDPEKKKRYKENLKRRSKHFSELRHGQKIKYIKSALDTPFSTSSVPDELIRLTASMLAHSPEERPDLKQIISDLNTLQRSLSGAKGKTGVSQ